MNAEQELYDLIYRKCMKLTDDTFDYLPPEDETVNYPFIHVGNLDFIGSQTKTSVGGRYSLTVDIWGTKEQRIKVSNLGNALLEQCQGFLVSKNFKFHAFYNEQEKRMMTDTSVPNTVFQRCNLTLVFHRY